MRQSVAFIIDGVVCSPLVRWTWSGLGEQKLNRPLTEFRPSDSESVREMMAGRYLLASTLADTQGLSPFSITAPNDAWWQDLQGFSWLRHFRDAPGQAEQRFALTLTLDWIGRYGGFDPKAWAIRLTARRLLNWLRHFPLILSEASVEQKRSVLRSFSTQLQSLRLRGRLAADPVDQLFSAIALLAAEVCADTDETAVAERLHYLTQLLGSQLDGDGMHLSRHPGLQFDLLMALVSLAQSIGTEDSATAKTLRDYIERMQSALGWLTLGTGEPVYFNGCGQLAADLLVVLKGQAAARQKESGICAGYGVLVEGPSIVVIDNGKVPPVGFAGQAHASGLAFEFSHGNELVVGNCGPAPSSLDESAHLFRMGAAHSGPTVSGRSTARLLQRGRYAGQLQGYGHAGEIEFYDADPGLEVTSDAFQSRFGFKLRRSLTLLSDGDTLVGQDSISAAGTGAVRGDLNIRFHLAPGASAIKVERENIVRITLKSGAQWSFLWEGGDALIEESVRQSAYFGFFRTQQIAIECPVEDGKEISWIFTRQNY